MRFPNELSGDGLHRVGVGMLVTKVRDPSLALLSDADGRAHGKICVENPVNATGCCAKRIDFAFSAPDEHAPAGNRGLRVNARDSGESESPLEF